VREINDGIDDRFIDIIDIIDSLVVARKKMSSEDARCDLRERMIKLCTHIFIHLRRFMLSSHRHEYVFVRTNFRYTEITNSVRLDF